MFFTKLGAELFPTVPPYSITAHMSDGTHYGGIVEFELSEKARPFWMIDRWTADLHCAYICFVHSGETHHVHAVLNYLMYPQVEPNPYAHAPSKVYIRILKGDVYYRAGIFENFHLEMTDFDRSNRIFITMPGGPIFTAKLVHLQEKPTQGIVPRNLFGAYRMQKDVDAWRRYQRVRFPYKIHKT